MTARRRAPGTGSGGRDTAARTALVLLLMVALVSCSMIIGRAKGVTAGPEVLRDVEYAPQEPVGSRGHLLDLYLPARTGEAVPVVLWSHGSGWLEENGRDGAELVAARLNPLGIAVAGVAIRSSAAVRFPGQVYDVKAAIRFLKYDAERYGLDPDRFVVMGESSGGWAAAMAAVTGDVPELEGDVGVLGPSSTVAAAIPFYPPTDFSQLDAHMIDCASFDRAFRVTGCHDDPGSPASLLLGCALPTCPDRVREADPLTYVDGDTPPFLIMHGTDDLVVPRQQSELLIEALGRACVDAALVTVPGGQHGAWDQWLEGRAPGGTSATVTSGCESRQEPMTADWGTVLAFLQRTVG